MKKLNVNEIKDIQVNILKEVDKFCRDNNITYYIAYGTLLGAVRHKGYIPWDDDIDIAMMRDDYEKFIKLFNNNREDKYEVLHYTLNKGLPYIFAKVHDKTTKLVENIDNNYDDLGVNIDVFVIDNMGDNKNNINIILNKCNIWKKLLSVKIMIKNNPNRNKIKNIIVKCLKRLLCFVSIDKIVCKINKISQKFNNSKKAYVSVISECSVSNAKTFEYKWFKELDEYDFEGFKVMGPKEYDKILNEEYGDYMKLPPKEERVTHHDYVAYRR